jgi:hypothetical protein
MEEISIQELELAIYETSCRETLLSLRGWHFVFLARFLRYTKGKMATIWQSKFLEESASLPSCHFQLGSF